MSKILFAAILLIASWNIPAHAQLRVEVASGSQSLGAGRLVLFVRSAERNASFPESVDGNAFEPDGLIVAAREITGVKSGCSVGIDGDDLSYPTSLAHLTPGSYVVQAVLDSNHDYVYSGRGAGDVLSEVAMVDVGSEPATVKLTLGRTVPPLGAWDTPWGPAAEGDELAHLKHVATHFAVSSPTLEKFHGRKMELRGIVVVPLDYASTKDKLPVVYFTHGFGGAMPALNDTAMGLVRQIKAGNMPRLVWVLLDQSGPTGTHEFADSLNNGPWGTALTTEMLPYIEATYRTDARPGARFVMGHSSGGWAALWLQLAYPSVFGGAWATSPDYSDFTDFGGVDLTSQRALFNNTTLARMEAVLGEYGGQTTSFEAVWSPRGPDGRPMPLFDRQTGAVDQEVAQWWRAHWDLTEKVRREWRGNRALLDGKVHVVVGEEDQFGLDDSARRLESAIKNVDGRASFKYLAGKGHFDLYVQGPERAALRRVMAWEMWHQAQTK